MLRSWIVSLGVLCALSIIVDAHLERDIHGHMQNLRRRMHGMSEPHRQMEMSEFKAWVFRNMHWRFVFNNGARLQDLQRMMAAMMQAQEAGVQLAMQNLMRSLQRSGAPSADISNFWQNFNSRSAAGWFKNAKPSPHKTFFPLTTTSNYNGAQAACRAKGGSLAVLRNSAEAQKAWQAVAGRTGQLYYVEVKSLPEMFRKLYPQLLGAEMTSSSSPHAKCLTIKPSQLNHFVIVKCGDQHAALCEKFDFNAPLKQIVFKGFVYYKELHTIAEARKVCASINGTLATIRSASEQAEAFSHVKIEKFSNPAFIDAAYVDGKWRWNSTRQNLGFENWGVFSKGPNDRCAVMQSQRSYTRMAVSAAGNWRPVSCASRNAFLCEVQVIPDSFVRLIDAHAVGKYFVAHKDLQTQDAAKRRCRHMASIRNQEQLAAAMLAAKHVGRVGLGMDDRRKPGEFMWADSSAVSKELLDEQLIGFNARNKSHRCVVMDEHGRWLTTSCSEKTGYLCEVPYRKKPTHEDNKANEATFQMDVRFDASYEDITRTWQDREDFIRAAELPLVQAVGGSKGDVVVSGIRSGSIIVTYRFYVFNMDENIEKVKRAVKDGRTIIRFKGKTIHPTIEQNYNVDMYLTICGFPWRPRYKKWFIPVVLMSVIVFFIGSVIVLIRCCKKRKILTARVASTVSMKEPELEKKVPPPDERLPTYEETVPPPYSPPTGVAPPPYMAKHEMPDVKT